MSTHTLAAPAGAGVHTGLRIGPVSRAWTLALCVLMPALAVVLTLMLSYAAITERVYGAENGVTGELLPRHSVGQTFRARYNGLKGVSLHIGTYGDTARTGAVLHIKRDTQSPDVRTATVTAEQLAGRDPWYTFTFAPVEGSQNQPFYAVLESPGARPGKAITLFQRISTDEADTYTGGTAYRDGRVEPGDLAFGLVYAPSPAAAFAQVARSMSTNSPLWILASLLLLFVTGIMLLIRLLLNGKRGDAAMRAALPALLIIALSHGLLYALITPPWQGPDEPSHFAYAALLDKYGLNASQVQKLDWQHGKEDSALMAAISGSMNKSGFTRLVAGYSAPGAPADPGTSIYSELRQPPLYYLLGAAAMRAARAVGFHADPYTHPEGALLALRVLSVLLNLVVITLAWLAGKIIKTHLGGPRLMPVLLPLTIALLPMHAFASGMANNDIAAEIAVSALVVALIGLLKGRGAARGGLWAGAVVLAALACTQTKSSALAAALPLVALGLVAWPATRLSPRMRRFYPVVVGAFALFVAGVFLSGLLSAPLGSAAYWHLNKQPVDKAPTAQSPSAKDGGYMLTLARDNNAWQSVALPTSQGNEVTLTGYARPRAESVTGATAVVILDVAGGGKTSVPLSGHAWTPFSVSAKVPAGTALMNVRMYARKGGVEYDGLQMSGAQLANASFETQELGPKGVLKHMPEEARWIWITLANPQPFNEAALWAKYAGEQFRSFWGNFGWVSVPLPGAWYYFWGVVTLPALLFQLSLYKRSSPTLRALTLVFFGSLLLTVLFGFARQTMLLSVFNIGAYPQGRYLFVLSIPFAWLLVSGIAEGYRLVKRLMERVLPISPEGAARPNLAAWVWTNAMLGFAMFSLFSLVIPYFYA